jgi:hypothetical protein
MDEYEVWTLHKSRTVLCQVAGLGVPAAAVRSSDGTIGGTYFEKDDYLGPFQVAANDTDEWGEAGKIAKEKAEELGYKLEYFDPRFEEGEEDFDGPATHGPECTCEDCLQNYPEPSYLLDDEEEALLEEELYL